MANDAERQKIVSIRSKVSALEKVSDQDEQQTLLQIIDGAVVKEACSDADSLTAEIARLTEKSIALEAQVAKLEGK